MDNTIQLGRKLISQAKPQKHWDSASIQATFDTVGEAVIDELVSTVLSLTD